MTKVHRITVATALALGYAAGFASDGLLSASAIESERSENLSMYLPQGAEESLETYIVNQGCDALDAKLGLTGADVCSATNIRAASQNWKADPENPGERRIHMSVRFGVNGSWSPGDPQ
jgi:hypothetical protein